MKRIAIVLFAFSFVAYPARADGIKGLAGALGVGSISSILCTLTSAFGWGDEDLSSEGFDRRGFFIGVGGGFAGENFSDSEATATADDGWSVKGGGGYRCHPRYSVGASFEYFAGFDTQWPVVSDIYDGDIEIYVGTFDIKGYLLTGRYQPYLLLGGGVFAARSGVTAYLGSQFPDYTDFVFRFGGGFDAYATDHVVVNIGASYLLPLGVVSGLELFRVGGGIEYRF